MRCSRLLPLLALLIASTQLPAMQEPPKGEKGAAGKDAKTKKKKDLSAPITEEEVATSKRRSERLFGDDKPLEFTLVADFKAAFKSRDTLKVKTTKASLLVKDSSGATVTIPVEISPRGHYRLRNDVCNFPPIRLIFPKTGLKGTPFAGQEALKLGTHCRTNDKEYAEYPVREFAAYEALNMLTDASFKARLANVTYIPTGQEADSSTKIGLLIEDEGDMSKRNGGRVHTIRGGTFDDMDPAQMAIVSVFGYYLGNTDFSLSSLHNIRLVALPDGRYLPISYDFDWSGIVFARYAKPDYRLGIKTVQDRLYRGACFTPAQLAPVFAKFNEKKAAIREMYTNLPLDDGYRRKALDYVEEFYRVINDQRMAKRELIDGCAKSG